MQIRASIIREEFSILLNWDYLPRKNETLVSELPKVSAELWQGSAGFNIDWLIEHPQHEDKLGEVTVGEEEESQSKDARRRWKE